MKRKVMLTRTVELIVEGKDEEAIMDWLSQTTPEEACELAHGSFRDIYDEDILCNVKNSVVANYVIKEDKEDDN